MDVRKKNENHKHTHTIVVGSLNVGFTVIILRIFFLLFGFTDYHCKKNANIVKYFACFRVITKSIFFCLACRFFLIPESFCLMGNSSKI